MKRFAFLLLLLALACDSPQSAPGIYQPELIARINGCEVYRLAENPAYTRIVLCPDSTHLRPAVWGH